MSNDDLDALDARIAHIVGYPLAISSLSGKAIRADNSRYTPTRDAEETLRLIEKYVSKLVRMNDGGWAAIGPNGRACGGPTLSIAVCKAIAEAH